jgi:hypothetical protein
MINNSKSYEHWWVIFPSRALVASRQVIVDAEAHESNGCETNL